MLEPLTEAQSELLTYITNHLVSQQYAPSIRQMMKAMGLRSPAPVQARLELLRSKGYVTWEYGKARTLRLLNEGIPIVGTIVRHGEVQDCEPERWLKLEAESLTPVLCKAYQVHSEKLKPWLIGLGDYLVFSESTTNGPLFIIEIEGTTPYIARRIAPNLFELPDGQTLRHNQIRRRSGSLVANWRPFSS